MEYNSQQILALENNLHQLLIANAGSGKTAVLVEKFYRLITQLPLDDIQRVVAITFTRKAASEMQERIVRTINEQLEKQAKIEKNSDYLKLVLLRERISSAKIQTIHSFCQEILSEYAVNIGFNPNFSVFEDYHFQKIYKDFFDDTLEDFMENDDEFKFVFDTISENQFNKIIKLLIDNNTWLNDLDEYYNKDKELIIKDIEKNYFEIISNFFETNEPKLLSNINLFNEKNQHKINELYETLNQITSCSYDNLLNISNLLKKVIELTYKGNSRYLKSILPPKDYTLITNLLKEVEKIQEYSQLNYYSFFIDLMKKLIRFAYELHQKIEKYKKRNSLITYNDMIYKVLDLFKDPNVVKKVSEKYDYFLIDEFQDTDEHQFMIFRQLAFASENQHKFLFLVGDPKQSIYGFRNADVRVVNSAKNLVETKNKELIELANDLNKNLIKSKIENQNYGKLELSISYRLNLVNTAFVNHQFSKIMNQPQQTGYEVAYNPLIYSRFNPYLPDKNIDISPNLNELHKFGSVKLLNTIIKPKEQNNDNQENLDDQNEIIDQETNQFDKEMDNLEEAKAVSDYIKYIINNKTRIFDVKLGKERALESSDIAILVRKNSLINNLTKALDRNSIPFALTGAEDFFETQEIIDIISFLHFINNPNDNYYFLATFKSYFFNIDDQTLYDIMYSSDAEGNSYWEIINNYHTKNDSVDPKIQRAISIINDILTKKEFYTVGDLVNYIFRITNYEEIFVGFSSRNLIYKNIDKFKNIVHQITSTGTNSIGELLIELELVKQSDDINSELEMSTENAVNILTMHKAKGLEFPVVIIYHANFRQNNRKDKTFYKNKFPNFRFNLLTNNDRFEVETPLFAFINSQQQMINEEEEKRLFYVAATRAKDLLIISSTLEPDKKHDYSKSMKQGFGKYYFPLFYDHDPKSGKIHFQSNFSDELNNIYKDNIQEFANSRDIIILNEEIKIQLDENQSNTLSLNFPIEILNNFVYNEKLDYKQETKFIEPIILLQNVEFPKQDQQISATSLQLFRKNKRNYFLRYITNFNLDYIDLIDKESDIDLHKLKGKDRGTIIHNTIANIHQWYTQNGINQEKLKAEINRNIIDELDNQSILEIQQDIQEEINRVFATDFIKSRIDNILKSQFEIPFYFYWEERYVDIIMDLLYCDENGIYEIWDWKNNIINSDDEYFEIVDYYSLQMKFYCFVLSRHHPNQKEFVARLFFTRLAQKDTKWMKEFHWSRTDLQKFEEELKEISTCMFDAKSINFD